MANADQPDFTVLTSQFLAAYLSNNAVPIDQLPGLIEQTRVTLARRHEPVAVEAALEQTFTPAVSVRKSLSSHHHTVSMIDGKGCHSLQRHLFANCPAPAEYRARHKLPADYPMVAPGDFKEWRAVARRLGLGRAAQASPPAPASTELAAEASEAAPVAKQRRRKAAAPCAG